MLPQTWTQVAVIAAAVIPGFVYQVSRRGAAGPGPDERDISIRVLRSITTSVIFAGVYAVLWGRTVAPYLSAPGLVGRRIEIVAASTMLLVAVIPWIAAKVMFYATTSKWFLTGAARLRNWTHLRRSWDPTPSAWDYAFRDLRPCWVRVLLENGSWVGGRFGGDSFASSWPDPEELYIEIGYVMNADGTFSDDVSAPNGVYVKCGKAVLVDFIADTPDTGQSDTRKEGQ